MNLAHVHLLVNHVPVLWTVLGLLVLLVAIARGSGDGKKSALGIFVISALATLPAYLTGEPAGDIATPLAGVSARRIHPHEEWAAWALGANLVLGALALVCLVLYRRSRDVPRAWTTAALVLALAASGFLGWTAALGGRIHHEESRPGGQGEHEDDH